MNLKYFFIFIFIVIILFIYLKNFINLEHFISGLILLNEFEKNEKYLKFCNNIDLKLNSYKKINNPKISVISPIYNRERFIKRFLINIQYQQFNDIEIVFIDDSSLDKSAKIIEEYKKIDKRIILIKNIKKRGTFISRNIGVLYSKSIYVILPDPDDIISKNILNFCFKISKKYNYEIIRFNEYRGEKRLFFNDFVEQLENKPIYQPELSSYIYYGIKELQIIDASLSNKFIKKEAYTRGINYLSKYYINMYLIFMEDSMMNYILQKTAKSFIFYKKIGYYYIKSSQSITKTLFRLSGLNQQFVLIYLKLVYEYSKNNKNERDMFNLHFTNFNIKYNILSKLSSSFNNNFDFYSKIILMFLKCKYISRENKILLKKLIKF